MADGRVEIIGAYEEVEYENEPLLTGGITDEYGPVSLYVHFTDVPPGFHKILLYLKGHPMYFWESPILQVKPEHKGEIERVILTTIPARVLPLGSENRYEITLGGKVLAEAKLRIISPRHSEVNRATRRKVERERERSAGRTGQAKQVPLPPGLLRVKLPPGPGIHWFAPKTHDLLDKRTIDKLGLTWAALYVNQKVNVRPNYHFLKPEELELLEALGIPARSLAPFKFPWSDVILPGLPERVNKERFFNNLVDLMLCYWSALRGIAFLHEHGLVEEAQRSRIASDLFEQYMQEQHGISRDEVAARVTQSLSVPLMDAKWFADATIARIRALWDKALMWLGEEFYCEKIEGNNWGDLDTGRIGQLVTKIIRKLPEGKERQLLTEFAHACSEIKEVRSHRDKDLHEISPRVREVLGRSDRDKDMLGLWEVLDVATAACSEGLMLCFATILAASGRLQQGRAPDSDQENNG